MSKVLLHAEPRHFDKSKNSGKQNDTILTNVSKMQDFALKYCCLENCQILSKPKTELYNVDQLDAIRRRWSIHQSPSFESANMDCLVWNESSDNNLQGSLMNEKPKISQKAAEPCIYTIPNSSPVSSRKLGFRAPFLKTFQCSFLQSVGPAWIWLILPVHGASHIIKCLIGREDVDG